MKSKITHRIIGIMLTAEKHFFPKYCGLLDRRRILAFLLLTLCELCIIPYHLVLFSVLGDYWGLGFCIFYALLLGTTEALVWGKKIKLPNGVAILYLMVFCKLVVDCILCHFFGYHDDYLSIPNNIFIMFILSFSALSLRFYRVNAIITVGIVLLLVGLLTHMPGIVTLLSIKGLFVSLIMDAFILVSLMDFMRMGLRKPTDASKEEEKAIQLLAELDHKADDQVSNLMSRLSPELRHKMIHRVADHMHRESMEMMEWEQVCPDLTKSERQICQLVVDGLSLKEICEKTKKTESNITSQRSHIRKKLNMDKQDDLKTTLLRRLLEIRGGGD